MVAGRVKVMGRGLLRWGLGLILSAQCLIVSAEASEAGLRVAFVYNFIKFIEWPELEGGELSLCVMGAQDATRQALGQLDNKMQQNRRIRVVYIDQVADIQPAVSVCELLYVTEAGVAMPIPETLPPGLLLVVDEASPVDVRVGISLMRTTDNRIEFLINDPAIDHAGVKVSSQLLKLAKKRQGARS